jgi:Ion channel
MSSVGYGDFYPITHFGRFVIVIAAFWGMVMVSQFIYTMEIQSNFSQAQSKAYGLIERLQKRNELRKEAA